MSLPLPSVSHIPNVTSVESTVRLTELLENAFGWMSPTNVTFAYIVHKPGKLPSVYDKINDVFPTPAVKRISK